MKRMKLLDAPAIPNEDGILLGSIGAAHSLQEKTRRNLKLSIIKGHVLFDCIPELKMLYRAEEEVGWIYNK